MAKNRNRQRDLSTPTGSLSQMLAFPIRPAPVLIPVTTPQQVLAHVPDARNWTPHPIPPKAHAVPRSAARLTASGPSGNRIAFADPQFVGLCVRRKTRKQVLFALNKTGKGSKSKRRRRSIWSEYSC